MAVEAGAPRGDASTQKLVAMLRKRLGTLYVSSKSLKDEVMINATRWRHIVERDKPVDRDYKIDQLRDLLEGAGYQSVADNLMGRKGTVEKVPRPAFRDTYDAIIANMGEGEGSAKPTSSDEPTPTAAPAQSADKATIAAPAGSTPAEIRAISEANGGANVEVAKSPNVGSQSTTNAPATTGSTSGGSGAGTGGGGGGGSAGSATVLQDTDFTGLPPGAQLWKVGNAISVAYQIEPGDPTEGYVYYTFPTPEAFQRAFPDGNNVPISLTQADLDKKGAVFIGSSNLLRDDLAKGWEEGFLHGFNNALRTSPWIDDDPRMLAEMMAATLEGRPIDSDYIRQVSGLSDPEIEYAEFVVRATDDELEQYHLSFEDTIRDQLEKAGVRSPDDAMVTYMARQRASGKWSEAYTSRQIIGLSNPYSGVTLDAGLAEATQGIEMTTLVSEAEQVKAFVKGWLGPHADAYSEEFYRSWAGAILDDPNAQDDLTSLMQKQRLALYPEYDNPNLTYEDISGPWKQQMARTWGTTINDLDQDVLDRVIRANDLQASGQILREEGFKRGNATVSTDIALQAFDAFGGQVRRAL